MDSLDNNDAVSSYGQIVIAMGPGIIFRCISVIHVIAVKLFCLVLFNPLPFL